MPRFSIIVPVEGDIEMFENTLASVLRRRPQDAEILVVHHGQYLDPHELDGEIRFSIAERDANLVRLFNRGLRESDSELVAVLRPGVELTDGWSKVIELAMDQEDRVASVSPGLAPRHRRHRLVAAGVQPAWGWTRQLVGIDGRTNSRSTRRLKPWGPTLWAAFYRRSALEQLGTPDEDLDPVYLDLDLAMGLRELGYQSRFTPECLCPVSQPERVLMEANEPHGLSAERARRRHPSTKRSPSPWVVAGWECLSGLVRPTNLKHLTQRFGASAYHDIDLGYARRLNEKRESRLETIRPDFNSARRPVGRAA